jgi:hypothetical protein
MNKSTLATVIVIAGVAFAGYLVYKHYQIANTGTGGNLNLNTLTSDLGSITSDLGSIFGGGSTNSDNSGDSTNSDDSGD